MNAGRLKGAIYCKQNLSQNLVLLNLSGLNANLRKADFNYYIKISACISEYNISALYLYILTQSRCSRSIGRSHLRVASMYKTAHMYNSHYIISTEEPTRDL